MFGSSTQQLWAATSYPPECKRCSHCPIPSVIPSAVSNTPGPRRRELTMLKVELRPGELLRLRTTFWRSNRCDHRRFLSRPGSFLHQCASHDSYRYRDEVENDTETPSYQTQEKVQTVTRIRKGRPSVSGGTVKNETLIASRCVDTAGYMGRTGGCLVREENIH